MVCLVFFFFDISVHFVRYILLHMLKYVPGIQRVYDEALRMKPRLLAFFPDHFKTEEMCNEVVEKDPNTIWHFPVHLRMQEMFFKAVEKYLYPLKFVSDHLKSHEMCDKVVHMGPY